MIVDILRRAKRNLLTGGFAKTVSLFLTDIGEEKGVFQHPIGKYLVNLSFDLEFGFGTTFWGQDIEKALSYGKISRTNLTPIVNFLREEVIPANVQIVAALLDSDIKTTSVFNARQQKMMREQANLFRLTEEDIAILKSHKLEIGLHGYSHRHFTNLSEAEAEKEMLLATEIFQKKFHNQPEFMAFPKNDIAHTDIIRKYGIKSWRSDKEHTISRFGVPLGHWFAPGVLGQNDLKKLLSAIKEMRQGYFLHLWGHFTEMDVDVLERLVEVIKEAGWEFTTVKDFKKY